jgi:hypothetical protein
MERSTTRAAKTFAIEWCDQIASRGIEYQHMVLLKILKHPIWRTVMSNYNEMEHAFDVVNNISQRWQQIKGSKDDQRTRNVIIPMIISESTNIIWKTNLLTCIHHWNLTFGIIKRLFFELHINNVL